METFSKGLDLTEQEFDLINQRISTEIGENYASKTSVTDKGYWLEIVDAYEKYFTETEIESAVVYTPKNIYTPPPLSPYAVVIPEIYQWAFPENKFVLSGFEIPLDTHNNDKVVNLAYFMWSEFRAELDSGNYEDLKRALMPLWDYVELQVINNNLVIL
jgi:hypothetical protein